MKKLRFSVDDLQLLEDTHNSHFALAKIDAFASGNNEHELYVSEETLKKTAHTIKSKPIIWEYDPVTDDAGTHGENEIAAGFVPDDTPIDFRVLPDGRTMMTVTGRIWKKYASKVVDFFKRDVRKSVSVELEVLDLVEENGIQEIRNLCFDAITILGTFVKPAIPLAGMEIYQFAARENEEYKRIWQEEFPKEDSNWFTKVLNTKPSKKDDLVNAVGEKEVFAVSDEDKEKVEKMADEKKELEEEKEEAKEKPVEEKKEAEEVKKEEMAAEEPKKEEVEKEEEKKFSLDAFVDVAATLAFLEEETEANEEMAEQVKMAADELRDKKEFAEPGKVMMGMFGKMKQLACKMAKIKEEQKAYMAENEELKKFKADTEAAQFGFEISKTMAEVKEDLPKEEFEALQEKAKEFSISNVDGWKNLVYAKTYEFAKKNKNQDALGYTPVGLPFADIKETKKSLWD